MLPFKTFSPVSVREVTIPYVSQWKDSVIFFEEPLIYPWQELGYPYSWADLRARGNVNVPYGILTQDGQRYMVSQEDPEVYLKQQDGML